MTYLSWHRQRKSVRTWGSWWNSRVFASISLIQNTFRCHLLLKAFQFSPNPKWLIFCLSKLLFLLQALVSPTILFQWISLSYQAAKTGAIFCHHISTSCLVFRNRRFFASAKKVWWFQKIIKKGLMISWVSTLWIKELVEREGLQG